MSTLEAEYTTQSRRAELVANAYHAHQHATRALQHAVQLFRACGEHGMADAYLRDAEALQARAVDHLREVRGRPDTRASSIEGGTPAVIVANVEPVRRAIYEPLGSVMAEVARDLAARGVAIDPVKIIAEIRGEEDLDTRATGFVDVSPACACLNVTVAHDKSATQVATEAEDKSVPPPVVASVAESLPMFTTPLTAEQCAAKEREVLAACTEALKHVDAYAATGTQQNEVARKFIGVARALASRWREDAAMLKHARQRLDGAEAILRGEK